MKHPKVEIYRERCERCVGTGELESDDSTDDRIFTCRTCDGDGKLKWRWRLKAANGEIVCSGEGHTRPSDAERGFRDAAATVLILVTNALEFGANWDIEVVDEGSGN